MSPLSPFALVWLKRDLRTTDHAPILKACRWAKANGGEVVLVYLVEPSLLAQPDSSPQHHNFALECIQDLVRSACVGSRLLICMAEAEAFFAIVSKMPVDKAIFGHQETGNWASFQRDLAVKRVLAEATVCWHEFQTNGVIRGYVDRDDWSASWGLAMQGEPYDSVTAVSKQPPLSTDLRNHFSKTLGSHGVLNVWLESSAELPSWSCHTNLFPRSLRDKPLRQRGGRAEAQAYLSEFLAYRGLGYRKEMSSPLTAESACSRISPYLTFGVLSVREVLAELELKRFSLSKLPAQEQRYWRLSLKSFESRLHWHCHFIQKLESEPDLELHAAHRGLDTLRTRIQEDPSKATLLEAWIQGKTGFPMVDACMRMLNKTGWINFRMRAMLVAFASYQLWLDWRDTAPLLAREFLDYEPGIHFPQFQMQSGVTGINTLRIYNPIKQAMDHDPNGVFVKAWLPELKKLPHPWLFEPWKIPAIIEKDLNFHIGSDYPAPIVDPSAAIAVARERMSMFRKAEGFEMESKRVYNKHGSRNPNRNGRVSKSKKSKKGTDQASQQLDLFD